MIVPPIAMLHHVEDRTDWASLSPYCIQRETFSLLLDCIERMGKKGVSLATALAKPDRKNVVLTFDDGAQHLWDYAIPELLKRGMTASFFIPTHHMGQTNSWDVAEGRAEVQLMDTKAIRELKAVGMEVGGHSHQHIRLGDMDADHDKLWAAAELAGAAEIIHSRDDGMDTRLGAEGARLSGGEKRRIALARLLIRKDADLYLLDEPTEGLDIESEASILDSALGVLKDKTVIVVSHRPSTLERFDRVIRLEAGRLISGA